MSEEESPPPIPPIMPSGGSVLASTISASISLTPVPPSLTPSPLLIPTETSTFAELGIQMSEGMRVALSPRSRFFDQSKGTLGTIKSFQGEEWWDIVWDWGGLLAYQSNDLCPAGPYRVNKRFHQLVKSRAQSFLKQSKKIAQTKFFHVSSEFHNFLANRLDTHLEKAKPDPNYWVRTTPEIIIVGRTRNLLTHALVLPNQRANGGCEQMPTLSKKQLTLSYLHFAKLGIPVVGLVRLGFSFEPTAMQSAHIKLGEMLGFIISFHPKLVRIDFYGNSKQSMHYLVKKSVPDSRFFEMNENGFITEATTKTT